MFFSSMRQVRAVLVQSRVLDMENWKEAEKNIKNNAIDSEITQRIDTDFRHHKKRSLQKKIDFYFLDI